MKMEVTQVSLDWFVWDNLHRSNIGISPFLPGFGNRGFRGKSGLLNGSPVTTETPNSPRMS